MKSLIGKEEIRYMKATPKKDIQTYGGNIFVTGIYYKVTGIYETTHGAIVVDVVDDNGNELQNLSKDMLVIDTIDGELVPVIFL